MDVYDVAGKIESALDSVLHDGDPAPFFTDAFVAGGSSTEAMVHVRVTDAETEVEQTFSVLVRDLEEEE